MPLDMVSNRSPIILSLDSTGDLVEHLLARDAPATTLIVCSTRDAFLQQLCAAVTSTEQGTEQPPSPQDDHGMDYHISSNCRFYNTIGLIAQSKKVTLAFCPSLEHFRAYISVFRRRRLPSPQQEHGRLSYRSRPVLAVLGLIALHYDTKEFSAQGIAKNLALTVEIAAREGFNLTLCECVVVGRENASGGRLWDAEVPLLSGQTLVAGTESAHTGRTVKVNQVARRWFYFV
ncbi:hypothetical protein RJZ56_003898 [Blastomyces dermatitidis]|uniref:Uncharacterized protein n=2 Tax=Blastomyces TaxID=229219 RepID=A0A179UDC6_BLAGS|nr:uncharacterized protein BDBG_01047 [Blastomyces gilchristii SLH14081]XP_045280725.1 uncharacterized protein BDCG_04056 [Blastomyces dermatitidis ER-3]EQL32762.1 hypothetical protein BDFG_05148 [Blastomyces dermatitidis ATCC 26199]OAT00998.1 hypothetical protein BDCG_04056 [Blastomyces dermatitidis ER-3]OAT04502.1 hypothetical protein BDBG_01047 [Blastomyces gilchristii SLH14081]